MRNRTRLFYTTACLLFVFGTSFAQDRFLEEDYNLQAIYIDANLQKILGNTDKAIELYQEAFKQDRENHAAAFELARLYLEREEIEQALKHAKLAVDIAPDIEWYQMLLAEVHQKDNAFDEAAMLYEGLVKADPNNDYYYYRWAYFLVKANQIEAAVEVYNQLEEKIGVNEELIRRKHSLYLGIGNNKKAIEELQRLIDAFPKEPKYLVLLSEFYEQIGEQKKALKVYEQILALDPDNVKAKFALAQADAEENGAASFLNSMAPLFKDKDTDIDVKITKIIPYIQEVANNGDKELAMALLGLTQILEEVHPNDAKGFAASADLLYYAGKTDEALEKYKATVELDETVYLVWEQMLYIYLEKRDFKNAAKTADEALYIFPNKVQLYYLNGLANKELGKQDDAIDLLNEALYMAGNNPTLQISINHQLGLLYHDAADYGSSDRAFGKALEINDKSPIILNDYSYMLSLRGQMLDKAAEMASLLNELAPNEPAFQDTYGWVLYKMKDYKEAKNWLEKAIQNGGAKDGTILEHLGDTLFSLGNTEDAVQYWMKALEAGDGSELLEKKIADRQLYE